MQTFDCPKCGAPVTYQPGAGATARCVYCNSQLAVPDQLRGQPARVIGQIEVHVGPQVSTGSLKWVWLLVLVPIVIVVITLAGVFGALAPVLRSVGNSNARSLSNGSSRPSGSQTRGNAGGFADVSMRFGSEGIGPGMMTDARSVAVDGFGRIYVGEYEGGRIQVFDSSGKFITQWMVDTKMPLRALAADRKGTVYVVQSGIINRYEGETGKSRGQISYPQGWGFDDVITTADGGLLCAWYKNRDDIVRFNPQGQVWRTIRAAISSVTDNSELDTRVASDGLGNVYALGTFNNAVFKFGPDGKYLNRFGGRGDKPGQFTAPSAIAADGKGRVYVSDFKGIQVFDSDGRYLSVFKTEGPASGMVFDDKDELFVAARTKVIKFSLNQ